MARKKVEDEYDDTGVASNPGRLRINPIRWAVHYPLWPSIWTGSLALTIVATWIIDGAFIFLAVPCLALNFLYWRNLRLHFWLGCANPAIVVTLDPMLVAVLSDLSKGEEDYPVIKIIRFPASRVMGQLPQIGSRLVTVATYSNKWDPHLPHWDDFDPRPIDAVTTNIGELDRLMSTFSAESWRAFASCLKQVPRPYRVGLYHLKL